MAAFFAWLLPVVGDTASVEPRRAGAPARVRAVRRPVGGHARPLLRGARALRPLGRGRRGGAAAAPVRRARGAPALGRLRGRGALAIFAITPCAVRSSRRSPTPSRCRSRVVWRGSSRSGSRSRAGSACSRGCSARSSRPLALAARRRARSSSTPATSATSSTTAARAWATWFAVVGCVVALVVGFRGRPPLERRAALASCLLLLPTYVHGLTNWSPSPVATARDPLRRA